jgi:hypothetical protein
MTEETGKPNNAGYKTIEFWAGITRGFSAIVRLSGLWGELLWGSLMITKPLSSR